MLTFDLVKGKKGKKDGILILGNEAVGCSG